ncbi:alkyl hydroperoxide reductase AhpD [Microbacterium sorbitolivorans]|uniref:Carboxymuconolactone decarboxylase family protein n=1 Tax=Microbacterium sorbitolivorans TaxID=1867410 RepID=A0A367XTW6_9MICO|nr:carboxymuconolactone decarboxylase family protein [Microbacterium sorbitolivorans]RCK57065.1 carboxymuconolactone decarboxylase family protein [Microbacterium sorbitolivorans]GGF46929.1 alkyl hydroperoxide reductase AhpD [Microbacterium sorbitolivorans]
MTEQRVHLAKSAMDVYRSLEAFSKQVGAVCRENGVDDRLKELVQLRCSQINGCAYCMRVHVERAEKAGITMDELGQLSTWRESGVFTERERAALELAEAHTLIHADGISDDVYNRVGSVLTEEEYVAISWTAISINAFNRLTIAGRYPVPPLQG